MIYVLGAASQASAQLHQIVRERHFESLTILQVTHWEVMTHMTLIVLRLP